MPEVTQNPTIGVVVVTYDSGTIITECLESLFASRGVTVRTVVVDNASTDTTRENIRNWASGREAFQMPANSPLPPDTTVQKPVRLVEASTDASVEGRPPLVLLNSPVNGGYAYACNHGLTLLADDPDIDLFWIVNPDCVVPRNTAQIVCNAAKQGDFGMIGGRTIFYERPHEIQTDGGRVSRWTGTCVSVNAGHDAATTPTPPAESLDYITGAHLVVSRKFLHQVGPMTEDYFLYYEEVDWAFRRGDLPLRIVPEAIVYHRGGTSIGTGSTVRRPSPFANYFNYRNRRWFVGRHLPGRLPFFLAHALAKSVQLALKGASDEAEAVLRGALCFGPPRAVRERITDPAARRLAFEWTTHGK